MKDFTCICRDFFVKKTNLNTKVMIIGYVRVSTEKQHPENQMDEIRRYAHGNTLIIDKWIVEVVSGKTKAKGRKLGRLIRRLKKGDTVIVTEISRISRSLTDLMEVMGYCVNKGINIYTTKENYRFDDSINSKVLCFAFGLVAEIERNLISMRTKEALALRKAEGKQLGRKKGDCPKMAILAENESTIREFISQGMTNAEIGQKLGVSRSTFCKFKSSLLD